MSLAALSLAASFQFFFIAHRLMLTLDHSKSKMVDIMKFFTSIKNNPTTRKSVPDVIPRLVDEFLGPMQHLNWLSKLQWKKSR